MIAAGISSADLLNEWGICGTDQRDGAIKKGNPRRKAARMLFELKRKRRRRDANPR